MYSSIIWRLITFTLSSCSLIVALACTRTTVLLQALASFDIAWNYFLPSTVFCYCYFRIQSVIKRQFKPNHVAVQPSRSHSTNSFNISSRMPSSPLEVHEHPSNGQANTVTTAPSTALTSRQLNVVQTLIIVTASFVILWMPSAVTVILMYYEVILAYVYSPLNSIKASLPFIRTRDGTMCCDSNITREDLLSSLYNIIIIITIL